MVGRINIKRGRSKVDSKFGNVKVETDGRKFDSKAEAARYRVLKDMERVGIISGLRMQVPYPLRVRGELITTYVADFVYCDNGGSVIVEDVKGFRTREFIIKKKLMKAVNGIDILETGTKTKSRSKHKFGRGV